MPACQQLHVAQMTLAASAACALNVCGVQARFYCSLLHPSKAQAPHERMGANPAPHSRWFVLSQGHWASR
jgi:hypothetical protein